ncbi:uncharacterized protein SOCEGT47_020090 [Sorangium cellulosum]|uniref:KAP NTPase domain-containing protein n=1 Tax=Sorangium cellulosum TaxID=56 RepID=A0A4P2PYC2_SORCE|nr:hypothetical protein [Sorangium cellulosum]AUX21523.1 uncharacterized protein SOCEGT47_020090 [Sorangium cellulosum]
MGTGKSTELLRLREARETKEFVLLLDLRRHFAWMGDGEAIQRVASWEVIFLVGLSVLGAAREILPYEVPPQHVEELRQAWEQVADATETPKTSELDLGKVASGMITTAGSVLVPALGLSGGAAVGVGVTKAIAEGIRRMVPIGRSGRTLPDQDDAMQTLLGAVNVLVGHMQQQHRRVLLLIDGLDRIRDEERAFDLFLRSELLSQIACPTVICAPFALRSAPVGAAIPRFDTVVLANEPVLDKAHPERPGPGVPFFAEVYRRRTQDLPAPDAIGQDSLERLAYVSGGRARDFVKLVRGVAERAWTMDVTTATDEIVAGAVDEARRDRERGLDVGHLGVLRAVMADAQRQLPEDARARQLLDWGHLLPYPNESEWYYPHPLLTLHLLRAPGSTG